jgi:hypothetical protein
MVALTITIGGTVNIAPYESLKVEVSMPVDFVNDADRRVLEKQVIGIFDDLLTQFGRTDAKARTAIDSYRERILGTVIEAARPETLPPHPGTIPRTSDLPVSSPHTSGREVEPAIAPARDKPTAEIAPAPVQNGESNSAVSPQEQRSYKTGKEKFAEDKAAFNHAAAETAAHPANVIRGDYQCSECGREISKAEKDMSLLFAPAPLCKACLKKLQGGFTASKEKKGVKQ